MTDSDTWMLPAGTCITTAPGWTGEAVISRPTAPSALAASTALACGLPAERRVNAAQSVADDEGGRYDPAQRDRRAAVPPAVLLDGCRLVDEDELERLAATVDDRPPGDLLRRLVATIREARHAQALAERRWSRYAAVSTGLPLAPGRRWP